MADVAYARKYRPAVFNDYIGEDTKRLVMSRMKDPQNYPQVWLFYGERGCGKTSAARLLAPEYLCLNKVDGHACGHCEICQELQDNLISSEAGNITWGVTELNIASDSGKAAIAGVLEDGLQAPMAPLKYKVLIFDECHMATPQAQNLLLKYVEEPPKHLIIIFCTTDKDKMLETLLDRCQVKIHVKKAKPEDMTERLMYICKQEGIVTSKEALRLIVKKCDRNPRKSIMKLEEIAKGNSMRVDISAVRMFTDTLDSSLYLDYIKASRNGLESILAYIADLKAKDMDFKEFLNGLSGFIMDCMRVKYALGLEEYSIDFVKAVKQVFKEYTNSQFDTALQIIEKAVSEVGNNNSSEYAEMIVCLTATRLGKLKVLSVGLQNEMDLAILENRKGNKKAVEQKKKDASVDKTLKVEASDDMLQDVFGHSIVEVKPEQGMSLDLGKRDEPSLSIKDDEPKTETEFDRLMKELDM